MNITDEALSRALTDTMAKEYDRRYCTNCQTQQLASAGRMVRGGNGRNRWQCGKCCEQRKSRRAVR